MSEELVEARRHADAFADGADRKERARDVRCWR
jgi:hypothetical protein